MDKRNDGSWGQAGAVTFIVFLLTLFYSILRYNIYGEVSWNNLPLYISNKAIAFASIILIGLSYFLGPLARFWPNKFVSNLHLRKHFGLLGFGLASVHTIASLLIFDSGYYPRFFQGQKLTFNGELSLLFGVLAFAVFIIVALSSSHAFSANLNAVSWKRIQRTGYLAYIFVLLHVFFMGYRGWTDPSHWPGGLLPISLLSFSIILFVLLVRLLVVFLPKNPSNSRR